MITGLVIVNKVCILCLVELSHNEPLMYVLIRRSIIRAYMGSGYSKEFFKKSWSFEFLRTVGIIFFWVLAPSRLVGKFRRLGETHWFQLLSWSAPKRKCRHPYHISSTSVALSESCNSPTFFGWLMRLPHFKCSVWKEGIQILHICLR